MTVTVGSVKQVVVMLRKYCSFSKESDYVSITDWGNGEGKTVQVNTESGGVQSLDLTYGQWEALQVAWNYREEKQK